MNRWAIWIDIEGFSQLYDSPDQRALVALGALMEGLMKIGSKVFPEPPDRLFAHQLADGFVVVSEFGEPTAERPVSIATVLMQFILLKGGVARCAISQGSFADVIGCYPRAIRDAMDGAGVIMLGSGIMTVFPVMGTALINAHRLSRARPMGACLLVEKNLAEPMPAGCLSKRQRKTGIVLVDWVHSRTPMMRDIAKKAGMPLFEPQEVEKWLLAYIGRHRATMSERWIQDTSQYAGCQSDPATPPRESSS